MNTRSVCWFAVLLAAGLAGLSAAFLRGSSDLPSETSTNYWVTNADQQFASFVTAKMRLQKAGNPSVIRVVATNYSWPLIPPAWPAPSTNLSYAIWTNCMARGMAHKSPVRFLSGGGSGPANMLYNTNSLIYGWKGATAIMTFHEGLGGQHPITMVTRRHGYCAGHQTIPANGVGKSTYGQTNAYNFYSTQGGETNIGVWFIGTNNTHYRMVIYDAVSSSHSIWQPITLNHFYPNRLTTNVCPYDGDVGIYMFTEDVPPAVEVMRVSHRVSTITLQTLPNGFPLARAALHAGTNSISYPSLDHWVPWLSQNQQFDLFGWGMGVRTLAECGYYCPGDSGHPEMLPMPNGELVLIGGTSGSVVDRTMQAFCDMLTVRAGLNTNDYQLQVVDLSSAR
jgi:hypothetical protein